MSGYDTDMLASATALVGLTLAVYVGLTVMGVVAKARGVLSTQYSLTKAGPPPPDWLTNLGRNFANLCEVPILFYALVAFQLAAGITADATQAVLAYAFVASRYAHTVVHTTFNALGLRFALHRLGVLLLIVMWARFAFAAFIG